MDTNTFIKDNTTNIIDTLMNQTKELIQKANETNVNSSDSVMLLNTQITKLNGIEVDLVYLKSVFNTEVQNNIHKPSFNINKIYDSLNLSSIANELSTIDVVLNELHETGTTPKKHWYNVDVDAYKNLIEQRKRIKTESIASDENDYFEDDLATTSNLANFDDIFNSKLNTLERAINETPPKPSFNKIKEEYDSFTEEEKNQLRNIYKCSGTDEDQLKCIIKEILDGELNQKFEKLSEQQQEQNINTKKLEQTINMMVANFSKDVDNEQNTIDSINRLNDRYRLVINELRNKMDEQDRKNEVQQQDFKSVLTSIHNTLNTQNEEYVNSRSEDLTKILDAIRESISEQSLSEFQKLKESLDVIVVQRINELIAKVSKVEELDVVIHDLNDLSNSYTIEDLFKSFKDIDNKLNSVYSTYYDRITTEVAKLKMTIGNEMKKSDSSQIQKYLNINKDIKKIEDDIIKFTNEYKKDHSKLNTIKTNLDSLIVDVNNTVSSSQNVKNTGSSSQKRVRENDDVSSTSGFGDKRSRLNDG